VIHPENNATKDFKDLRNPEVFTKMFDKKQKLIKHFLKPEHDQSTDAVYMNTYRNGFVSAIAMAYNSHLPLVLSPNDIWIVVLNGFKIHMRKNADKEFFKLSFSNMKDLDKTIQKFLKIDGVDPEKMDNKMFETLLLETVNSAVEKVWNQGHKSSDFTPD
jgi:hypothetical protein